MTAKTLASACPSEKTYTLAESQLDVIEMALEQIGALAALLKNGGGAAVPVLDLVAERARWGAIVLRAGYAEPKLAAAVTNSGRAVRTCGQRERS